MANRTFKNSPTETPAHETELGNYQQYFAFRSPLALKNKDELWKSEEYQEGGELTLIPI